MPNYRLQFSSTDQPKPIRAVTWNARNPRDAFIMAQSHAGPAELWKDDEHVCTLQRIGVDGEIWLISQSLTCGRKQPAQEGAAASRSVRPRAEDGVVSDCRDTSPAAALRPPSRPG